MVNPNATQFCFPVQNEVSSSTAASHRVQQSTRCLAIRYFLDTLDSSPCRITAQEQTLQVLQSYQVFKSPMHLALWNTGIQVYMVYRRKEEDSNENNAIPLTDLVHLTENLQVFLCSIPFHPKSKKKKKKLISHFGYSPHPFLQCSFQPLCI